MLKPAVMMRLRMQICSSQLNTEGNKNLQSLQGLCNSSRAQEGACESSHTHTTNAHKMPWEFSQSQKHCDCVQETEKWAADMASHPPTHPLLSSVVINTAWIWSLSVRRSGEIIQTSSSHPRYPHKLSIWTMRHGKPDLQTVYTWLEIVRTHWFYEWF